jgi:hypothetical protein
MAAMTLRTALAAILLTAGSLSAQDQEGEPPRQRFEVELRGELALPLGELEDLVTQELGAGLGVAGRYWPLPYAAVYGGWDWFRFDEVVGQEEIKVYDSGFRGGVHLQRELGTSRVEPFVYGGVTSGRGRVVRREAETTERIRYRRSWGGEVGGGIVLPVRSRLSVVPEARYRTREAKAETEGSSVPELNIEYLGFNLGVRLEF